MTRNTLLGVSRIGVFATAMFTNATLFATQLIDIVPTGGGDIPIQPVRDTLVAPNTENDWTSIASGTGNVTTTTNWSLGHVPTVSEDAVFTSTSATGIKTYGTGATVGSPVTVGSLDVTATTGTYSIRNSTTSATDAFLTLGGVGNNGNGVTGSSPSDLIFVASGATLALRGDNPNGTGVLRVVLGQSGNFDAAGTIQVSSIISDGGNNFAITKTGAGALLLSGANTFGGGVTMDAGTLNINNASALGTGTFTINAGTINNTSGSAVTVSNAQTWGGDFTVGIGSGTSNLTFSGPITLTGNRSINVSGATSTLLISGVIGDSGNNFMLTKGGPGIGILTLGGANTYGGGTNISSGTLVVTAAGALGTGNVSLTAGNVTLTMQGATNMASTAALSYLNTDTINLSYSGTMTLAGLTVDGVSQAPGVYGNSAINPDNAFFGIGTITVVPEPATVGMVLLGAGLLTGVQRFRRRQG